MSDTTGSTLADHGELLPPPSPAAPVQAGGRRSRLDVALVLAAILAIGGVTFAAGRVSAAQTAATAQDCGPGGGGGGAPGAPEAPAAPGGAGGG